jgi:hypothetical protein
MIVVAQNLVRFNGEFWRIPVEVVWRDRIRGLFTSTQTDHDLVSPLVDRKNKVDLLNIGLITTLERVEYSTNYYYY